MACGLAVKPEPVADWEAALSAELGQVVSLQVDLDAGFTRPFRPAWL